MKSLAVFQMSGIYKDRDLRECFPGMDLCLFDCSEERGTNGFCDEEAKNRLRQQIVHMQACLESLHTETQQAEPLHTGDLCTEEPYTGKLHTGEDSEGSAEEDGRVEVPYGVHLLDNGNYHYLSALMTERIGEPYTLVLIDHHPDLQPSAFGWEVLSCGSWVLNALLAQENLKRVFALGVEETLKEEALLCVREAIGREEYERVRKKISFAYPKPEEVVGGIYLSIDKDVLAKKFVKTNWDQGEMTLPQLEDILRDLCTNHKVIGMDLSGAPDETVLQEHPEALKESLLIDSHLVRVLQVSSCTQQGVKGWNSLTWGALNK